MARSVQSNDTLLSKILSDINAGTIQLPDFQRGWVWNDELIKKLIVSICKSYPVGALMMLKCGAANIQFKTRPIEGAPDSTKNVTPTQLILDGQQRLTSLYCSLFGKNAVKTETVQRSTVYRFYYLDIVKCLDGSDMLDAVLSIPQDKKVRSNFGRDVNKDYSTREQEFMLHAFPLNIIFDREETQKWRREYRKYHEDDKEVEYRYDRFEMMVLDSITAYQLPIIALEEDTPREAVCQVFENVNRGGVELTVFELITAMFATEATGGWDLRTDWEGGEKEINGQMAKFLGRFERYFEKNGSTPAVQSLLRSVRGEHFLVALTLLSRYKRRQSAKESGDDSPAVSCKRDDVLKLKLADYNLYADDLTEGYAQAAQFITLQGIYSNRDLPYNTQFVPLSVLFTVLKNRINESNVRDKIAQWYWSGVFGEMYGAANETRYANDVQDVVPWIDGGTTPATIREASFSPPRLLSIKTRNSAAYKGVMALLQKQRIFDFINCELIDPNYFAAQRIDIHHIFPSAYCKKTNINEAKWDSVVNKTPLSGATNRSLSGDAPSLYISRIIKLGYVDSNKLDQAIASHLIDVEDFRTNDFEQFFIKRAKALLDIISKSMGKEIDGRDSDEVKRLFGSSLV